MSSLGNWVAPPCWPTWLVRRAMSCLTSRSPTSVGSGIRALAELPSLDELRATIIGLIQAPASKIARTINEPGAMLARVIGAFAAKEDA